MESRDAVDQAVTRLRQLVAGPAMAEPGLREHVIRELESLLAQLRAAGRTDTGRQPEPEETDFWIAM